MGKKILIWDVQDELDWHLSALKYYQSSRVLSFFGYTKQAESLLCLGIEKLIKLYFCLCYNKPVEGTHDLKKLFLDSKLNKGEFVISHQICNSWVYNDLRYEFEITSNNLNVAYIDLDKEIKKISTLIIKLFNKKHNANVSFDRFNIKLKQDRKYKQYCLERSLKSHDTTFRIDFT